MRRIYLDHASTTYLENLQENFGNPSSIHYFGRKAKEELERARKKVADILNCQLSEIVFTNGGTESCNLAILGVARANKNRGNHIITTQIEHRAVLEPCRKLEKEGFKVTYLPVDKDGLVDPADVRKSLTKKTILVSVIYANNEIGTIEPIKEIGLEIKNWKLKINKKTPFFYSDACQATPFLDLDVRKLGVDLFTLSGSKIYGPKGSGVLYVRHRTLIEPIIFGSGQEFNLRSGTQNVAGIVGFAAALELVQEHRYSESKKLFQLREYLIREILKKIPEVIVNGHLKNRLPNNLNISIPGVDGEALLLYLDKEGIAVSAASACFDLQDGPSHVLKALGKFSTAELARQAHLRITLGKINTKKDIDYLLKVLPLLVKKLQR